MYIKTIIAEQAVEGGSRSTPPLDLKQIFLKIFERGFLQELFWFAIGANVINVKFL